MNVKKGQTYRIDGGRTVVIESVREDDRGGWVTWTDGRASVHSATTLTGFLQQRPQLVETDDEVQG